MSPALNELRNSPTAPAPAARQRPIHRDDAVSALYDEIYFINRLRPGRVLHVGAGTHHVLSAIDSRWQKERCSLLEWGRAGRAFDAVLLALEARPADGHAIAEQAQRATAPGGSFILAGVRSEDREDVHCALSERGLLPQQMECKRDEQTGSTTFTFYCERGRHSAVVGELAEASVLAYRVAIEQSQELERAALSLSLTQSANGSIVVTGDGATEQAERLCAAGYRAIACIDVSELPRSTGFRDLLIVLGVDAVPCDLVRAAARRGMLSLALVGERAETPGVDTCLRIPSTQRRRVEFVQSLVITTLCDAAFVLCEAALSVGDAPERTASLAA